MTDTITAANSRQTDAVTANTRLTDSVSRLPQYWEISTIAPPPSPDSAAVTKVLTLLACETGASASAWKRDTITLSAISTSREMSDCSAAGSDRRTSVL